MGSPFKRNDPNAPYRRAAAITPNDSAVFEETQALSISVAGNVALTFPGGTTGTIALPAGTTRISVTKVSATGTTATGIAALYLND